MQTFTFKVGASQEHDAKEAIAMWQLAWASRVVLGDMDDDGMATIEVTLADDWESGPSEMVAWVRGKLGGQKG